MERRQFIVTSSGLALIGGMSQIGVVSADVDYSDEVVWRGQTISITGDSIESEEEYELHLVDAFDGSDIEESTKVKDVAANTSGEIELESDDLGWGEYFLEGPGLGEPSSDDTFEVVEQSLDTEFERNSIERGLSSELQFDSNRASYSVDISSDGLTPEDLTSFLVDEGGFELASEQPGGDTIRLWDPGNGDLVRPVEEFPTGELTLEVKVVDAVAEDTASVTIDEQTRDVDISFPQNVNVEAGVEFSLAVVLDGASSGVGSYSFVASIDETEAATFDNVDLEGADIADVDVDVSVNDGQVSVTVGETASPGEHDARVATINLNAADRDTVAVGEMVLSEVAIEDDTGSGYDVSVPGPTTINVDRPGQGATSMQGAVWHGQTAVLEDSELDGEHNYQLRTADQIENGEVIESSFRQELKVLDGDRLEVDTGEFSPGDYFIQGHGEHTHPPNSETFEIKHQTLSAEFDVDEVQQGDSCELTIDSNRDEDYTVAVSARGDLTQEQLTELFVDGGGFELKDTHFGDGTTIEIVVPGSTAESVLFDGIGGGSYDFDFEEPITVATTTDSITVEADPCFIATAAYDTPTASEIDDLRAFRDDMLKPSWIGRWFVDLYYATSPPIADWIRASPRRRRVVRDYFVEPLVRLVRTVRSV